MKKYLVPIDGSNYSEMALKTAIDLAEKSGGSITMLAVIDIDSLAYSSHFNYSSSTFLEKNQLAFKQVLDDLEERYQSPAFSFEKKVTLGNVAGEIVDESENFYDLIVIGSRGLSALKRTFLGSISTKVVNTANVPTLVVRYHNKHTFNKILVPMDGSRNSRRALRKAMDLGKLDNSHITVLHVAEEIQIPNKDKHDLIPEGGRGENEKIRELFTKVAEYGQDYPHKIETLALEGNVSQVIVETAFQDEYDLIVIGSRGQGSFTRAFMGSVSNEVIHNTDKCVLVSR